MPKLDGLSGGADYEDKEAETTSGGIDEDGIDIALLESEIPNRDYAEYLIQAAKKDVKCEDYLVRQIVYIALSKDSTNPLNLLILAPTSEGKTHAVTKTLEYWPDFEVMYIGSMSPKVLIRMHGETVDENNEPIGRRERNLKRKIDEVRAELRASSRLRIKKKQQGLKDVDKTGRQVIEVEESADQAAAKRLEELEEDLEELYKRSKTVINLQGKLLVFLEPPHPETWNIIKPILSHDKYYMEHPYVDSKGTGGIHAVRVVTKGWPAVIVCSAKNESQYEYWSKVQSRFIVSSPNMVPEKYREGNKLIGMREGMTDALQQKLIISDTQSLVAKECVKYLISMIKGLGIRKVEEKKSLVWIPFTESLAESLPAEKGSMRLYTFLKIVAIVRSHLRKKLISGNETMIVADIKEDLHEALHLSQNRVGIPVFKLEMFENVFISAWKKQLKMEEQNDMDIQAGVEGAEKHSLKKLINGERMLILTAHQLCEELKAYNGRVMTTANMKRTYLDEFVNAGLIDEEELIDGRKTKAWYPIVDLDSFNGKSRNNNAFKTPKECEVDEPILERMKNITQHHKLLNHGKVMELDKKWLEESFLKTVSAVAIPDRFEIWDENNEQICICRFMKDYENDSNGYFKDFFATSKYVNYGPNPIYPNEIFEMKPLGKFDSLDLTYLYILIAHLHPLIALSMPSVL
jgi:hypothetical protein